MGIIDMSLNIRKMGIILLTMTMLLIYGFKPMSRGEFIHNYEAGLGASTTVPWLLNTGLAESQQAEIKIILWVESGTIPAEIWTQLPMPNWQWTAKVKQNPNGEISATLTGQQTITKDQERVLYTWYRKLPPDLSRQGVKVYIDERVPEVMDISAYLSQVNVQPLQWYLEQNMVSIAGYRNNLGASVLAGPDKVNFQLLCRGQNAEGQTVLAMPALLEEF